MQRRLIDLDGHHLHLRLWPGGEGLPLLLVHWTPLSGRMWEKVAPRLADERTVLAPDLLGYGQSDPRPEPWTVADWADQLVRLLDRLELARVHLAGGHMGAAVAAELAARHSGRVAGVVLDGVPLMNDALRAAFARLGRQRWPTAAEAPQWAGRRALALLAEYRPGWTLADAQVPGFLELQRDLLAAGIASSAPVALTQDLGAVLRRLAGPVLLLGATSDPLSPQFEAARALIPHARAMMLDGGHPLHDGDPQDRWTGPVRHFLRTIDSDGKTPALE